MLCRVGLVVFAVLFFGLGGWADSQWHPPYRGTIFFASASSQVPFQSMWWNLDTVQLAKAVDADIVVAAHADAHEPDPARLSQTRGESMKQALTMLGVKADHVVIRAIGAAKPIVTTPTGREEPQNRAVELEVINWRRKAPHDREYGSLPYRLPEWFKDVCERGLVSMSCGTAKGVYGR